MVGGVGREALDGAAGGFGEAVAHGEGDDGVAPAVDDEGGDFDGGHFLFGIEAVYEEE